ncbi:MAG: hypothetical protein QOD40_2343 [Alphaproteobacteria bacterium]|nr:hypothetical protein [Alphaproteobacteria bacterium]
MATRRKTTEEGTAGKRITFDRETLNALNLLASDRMMTLQELADEAFRDLLKKHGRPTDLRAALKQSAGENPPPDGVRKSKKRRD